MKILFLCSNNACLSRMAEAFATARKDSGVTAISAGLEPTKLLPQAVKVMEEVGVGLDEDSCRSLSDVDTSDIDLVVTLCHGSAEGCPIFPGHPEQVDWNLEFPKNVEGKKGLDALRELRDEVRRLVDDLFDRGYLYALVSAKCCADMIIDNISDGIIAHDLERRVFFFNRAAEKITGYGREDVIGKDCHEVFPGKFCGGKCKYCDDGVVVHGTLDQELDFITKDGEKKRLEMSVKMLKDIDGENTGVLASFHDATRERELARRLGERDHFAGIIGRDKKMLEVYDLIRDLADTDAPVLIQGDSGTGKELVAAAIHNEGPRAANLFVPVNCGALPESLLESELFGHVKGAFTGAIRDKKGRFELADGGTIFLDEIGDIPMTMQVKLLRVLQEGTFERVGSERTVKVDVRIISATNKNLITEIDEGHFREDLFYRLSVVPIDLPPLRERRNDIPLLVEHVLSRELERTGKPPVTISSEALDVMMSYDWPGNIRELQNWIQFALVKCKTEVIDPSHLPPPRGQRAQPQSVGTIRKRRKLDVLTVRAAIEATGGNKLEAARNLGVSRATLYRFIDEVGEL
jgi:PAS domain S-box-containing protein